MQIDDNKKAIERFYKANVKNQDVSTFSGLRRDMIYSSGSKKKEAWFYPYIKYKSLEESR